MLPRLARVALRPRAARLAAPKGIVVAAARRSFVSRPAARVSGVTVPSLARLPVRRASALVAAPAVAVRSFSSFQSRQEQQQQQQQQQQHRQQGRSTAFAKVFAAGLAAVGASVLLAAADDAKVNYDAVRKDIADILDAENYDDGSYGPLFVRLAWHASGTYDKASNTGGSDGATMRFKPESSDGANAGLALARDLLDKVKAKHPGISHADLWTLAGAVAIEELGGPKIAWRPGRRDKKENDPVPPNGRLPDATKKADHIRAVFYRMGFNDREIVALAGAHALGRCHRDRSGFEGPWTNAPTTFSNEYFRLLVEEKWTPRKWDGSAQFQDSTGKLMMLPADLAFVEDPEFRKFVQLYAKDEKAFFNDFAAAFAKLLELGVAFK